MKCWFKGARDKPWHEVTYDGWLDSLRSLMHWGQQAGGAIQPKPLEPGIPKEFATTQLLLCVSDDERPPGATTHADGVDHVMVPVDLFQALVELQRHYAELLNMHDGGARRPVPIPVELQALVPPGGPIPPLLGAADRDLVALALLGLTVRHDQQQDPVERVARKLGVLDELVKHARDWSEAAKEGKAEGNAVRVAGAGACPTCTMPLTGVKPARGGAPHTPTPDDVTICGNCGEILKFNAQMKVEPVNDQELTHLVTPVDADQLLSLQKTLRARYAEGRPR